MLEFFRPLLLAIGVGLKVGYYLVFAWWLTPWLRHRANRELVEDTERNLWFLIPEARAVKVLHAEWPTAQILSGNVLVTILRRQDETTVSVAPRYSATQSYQVGSLDDAARLVRIRFGDVNNAFSEEGFSHSRLQDIARLR